ncbi:MAG: ThiF family adenylyltransferase [Gemmataceae bacterium]|nr:ThiF family adenylyltransferase [Gemmataceae bacterium]
MNEPSTAAGGRDVRQRGLVPPERLARCNALVIGVGAIGRQVALQLATLGIARMTLFDDDLVQPENLAPQGYWPGDLQRPKVDATADLCCRIHPVIRITTIPERFKRSSPRDLAIDGVPVVFCCVDSIVMRRMLWDALRSSAYFFVDGRMSAEVLRVIAVGEPAVDDHYPRTLFAAEQAYVGPCTARSTIYTSSIAAGFMVHQFAKWLRGLPVGPDLTLNLLAGELTASE